MHREKTVHFYILLTATKKQNSRAGTLVNLLGFGLGRLLSKNMSKKEYEETVANGGGYYICKDCGAVTWIRPDKR